MPEASLYRLFTTRLNRLGIRHMLTGSVAAMVYDKPSNQKTTIDQ
jgi:hypothetical protein